MRGITIAFISIFTCLPMLGLCQKIFTSSVVYETYQILQEVLGDSAMEHITLDSSSSYIYKNVLGVKRTALLDATIHTKGTFVSAKVAWDVALPYPKCKAMDTVRGKCWFELDNDLKPISIPTLDFVPDFFWNQTECNLITENQAVNLAESDSIIYGEGPLITELIYHPENESFVWYLNSCVSKKTDWQGRESGERDEVYIDARTGKVTQHQFTSYKQLY